MLVTSERCTPVKNTSGWSAVVFCEGELIQNCARQKLAGSVCKFVSRVLID
jgi:uncharacterized membrane protein